MILFASTNKLKVLEASTILPNLTSVSLDLPEIQSPDVRVVVREKLVYAARLHPDQTIIVEDTGLYVDDWDGLPGAFVKWFVEGMGARKLAEKVLCGGGAKTARAVSAVGVLLNAEIKIAVGETLGQIVLPRGEEFGWNSIFQEATTGKTFGEMSFEERLAVSMREPPLREVASWI